MEGFCLTCAYPGNENFTRGELDDGLIAIRKFRVIVINKDGSLK